MSSIPRKLHPRSTRAAVLVGLALTLAHPARAQTHLDNPFVGARMYVDPDYTARAEASAAAAADPALAAAMRAAGAQPTAVWLDRVAAVAGMTTHLDRAVANGSDLVVFVLDDLPGRGCDAALTTEFPLTDDGLDRYRAEFVDVVFAVARQPLYAGVRMVFVVEPDSLAHLITGLSTPCVRGDGPYIYMEAVRYAVDTLHALPNAYLYLGLAEAGRLGWETNGEAMVALLGQLAEGFADGKDALDGFATNVAGYVPVEEPYIPAGMVILGQPVRSAAFYDWNPQFDDADYAATMYARLTAAGWPETIGMVTDTSRNGWGGRSRPNVPSASANLDVFVAASKVDRRAHRGLWCNQAGAGVGFRPQAAPTGFPDAHYDAYLWVKAPGESDGASADMYGSQRYVPMCDPQFQTEYGVLSGALGGAPFEGAWFPEHFAQLVQNAWPPLATAPAFTLSVARGGLGSGTVSSSPAGIQCGATCNADFPGGTVVTLTATPAAGSLFSRWTGACTSTAPTCVVTMNANRTATALFGDPPPMYTLTVSKAGSGSGVVTSVPAGIDCGASCRAGYTYITTVTLSAVPAAGASFAGWSGCVATGTTCTVSMSEAREVTATFDLVPGAPCAQAVTFRYNTGNLGTTGAVCYRTSQRVNGWGCANVEGRTVRLNGAAAPTPCGAGPFPLPRASDGYTYFSVSAGQWPWASIYTW